MKREKPVIGLMVNVKLDIEEIATLPMENAEALMLGITKVIIANQQVYGLNSESDYSAS